jgi:hypothetical protein
MKLDQMLEILLIITDDNVAKKVDIFFKDDESYYSFTLDEIKHRVSITDTNLLIFEQGGLIHYVDIDTIDEVIVNVRD